MRIVESRMEKWSIKCRLGIYLSIYLTTYIHIYIYFLEAQGWSLNDQSRVWGIQVLQQALFLLKPGYAKQGCPFFISKVIESWHFIP